MKISNIIIGGIFVVMIVGVFWMTAQNKVEKEDEGYTFYKGNTEIICKDGSSNYCGYHLSECNDGKEYLCVVNVERWRLDR